MSVDKTSKAYLSLRDDVRKRLLKGDDIMTVICDVGSAPRFGAAQLKMLREVIKDEASEDDMDQILNVTIKDMLPKVAARRH